MNPVRAIAALFLLTLGACANYGGHGLTVGKSSVDDALRIMGTPAMEWTNPDGSRQLAFTRGPAGAHTYMLHIGSDGKLASMANVLAPPTFSRIQAGMSSDDVLRLLGPPQPAWTVYFERRNELAWEWRYCDDWNQFARFAVLFDGSTRIVRSSLTRSESQISECGDTGGCWCSH
jgi:hypothetical protein